MEDKVELIFGALRFSPFWMGVDLILIGHFLFSWARSYRKTGWKIDFWYFTLFYYIFLHVLAIYPFNGSFLNIVATHAGFYLLDPFIDQAFFLSVLGYCSMLAGRFIFDRGLNGFPFQVLIRAFQPLSRIVESNMRTRHPSLFIAPCLLFFLVFAFVANGGDMWNPRAFFLENDSARPLYNFTHAFFSISLTYFFLRCIQFERFSMAKPIFFSLLFLSLFLGVRAMAILSLMSYASYRIFSRQGRFSFIKLGLYGCGILCLALLMDHIRYKEFDMVTWAGDFFLQTFYGNHFCHTRDLAWVLAEWDGEYAWGKTYLAALFSFLPRALSPFRQDWSVSVYTNSIVGFDSAEHAGLGLGIFGEAFLNFSYPGVIFLGLCAGYVLRHADCAIKKYVEEQGDIIKGYVQTLCFFFISHLFMTAGFWAFYVFLLVHGVLYGWRNFRWVRTEN